MPPSEERGALAEKALLAAKSVYQWAIVQDLEIGDRLRETRVQIPGESIPVVVEAKRGPWPFVRYDRWDRAYINRRITADRIELWSPTEGWLFDAEGTLLHHVTVPRRDGHGREWYGAFLPDGRWVTTDLWQSDRQLHFYAADGTFIRSLRTAEIMGEPEREGRGTGRIDWARSDKDGRGWIVKLLEEDGDDPNRSYRVLPDGTSELLSDPDPWLLAWPRALGTRIDRYRVYHRVLSDDAARWMTFEGVGHGPGVTYPVFGVLHTDFGDRAGNRPLVHLQESHPEFLQWNQSIYLGSRNFGFWPGSHLTFIDSRGSSEPARSERMKNLTIFISEDGEVAGCIEAERFADAADDRAMLFETPDERIVALNPDFTIQSVRRFHWPDGSPAPVEDLFDDLGLGLFRRGEDVSLGRYIP